MERKPGGLPFLGVALIVLGALLLLTRFSVISFDWVMLVWSGIAIFGATKLINGLREKKRGSAFWGTLLFLAGTYKLLHWIDAPGVYVFYSAPVFVLIIGLSFLMMFIADTKGFHWLVPALFFLTLGTAMVLSETGHLYRQEVIYALRRYWPFVLILFGVALLLKGRITEKPLIDPNHRSTPQST